jgi:hypothetical protein
MDAPAAAHEVDVQVIETPIVRLLASARNPLRTQQEPVREPIAGQFVDANGLPVRPWPLFSLLKTWVAFGLKRWSHSPAEARAHGARSSRMSTRCSARQHS